MDKLIFLGVAVLVILLVLWIIYSIIHSIVIAILYDKIRVYTGNRAEYQKFNTNTYINNYILRLGEKRIINSKKYLEFIFSYSHYNRTYTHSIVWEKNETLKRYKYLLNQEHLNQQHLNRLSRVEMVDTLDGRKFELFFGELLKMDGTFSQVKVTQASNDYGVDVIATNSQGKKIGYQTKLYSKNVGVKAVQEIKAGKDYFGLDSAVVVTNQYLTPNAKRMAKQVGVHTIERQELADMISNIPNLSEFIAHI